MSSRPEEATGEAVDGVAAGAAHAGVAADCMEKLDWAWVPSAFLVGAARGQPTRGLGAPRAGFRLFHKFLISLRRFVRPSFPEIVEALRRDRQLLGTPAGVARAAGVGAHGEEMGAAGVVGAGGSAGESESGRPAKRPKHMHI